MSIFENDFGYVVVGAFMPTDGSRDVSDDIQRLIDENPNRTLFFPDGTYCISKPILTPADPTKSVSLRLSNYAVIKACDGWDVTQGAMVRLGGKDAYNSIYINGSNYGLSGGIIDGNGVADGVSIDSGRETRITETSIKHTRIGIFVKYGANNGSSDADIMNVHIVGNGAKDSVGVYLEGLDNTLTNMRIADVQTGIYLKSAGNYLRYIHALYTIWGASEEQFLDSCAFLDVGGNNFYVNCYSDQYGIGYQTTESKLSTYDSCFCLWFAKKTRHIAFRANGKFKSVLSNFNVMFLSPENTENIVLSVAEEGGTGVIDRLITEEETCTDDGYLAYLDGGVLTH